MNIVDSLIVQLRLDPKEFSEGRKQAAADFLTTQEQIKADADKIDEATGKKISDAFRSMTREALAFIGVLMGAREIRDFVAATVAAESGLSTFSEAVGIAPSHLSAHADAVAAAGGSAQAATQAFRTFADLMTNISLTGRMPEMMARTVGATSLFGPGRENLEKLRVWNIKRAVAMPWSDLWKRRALAEYGITDTEEQTHWIKGDMEALEKDAQKSAMTDAQAASGSRLHGMWARTTQAGQAAGRTALDRLAGPLAGLLERLTKWIDESKPFISGWVNEKMTQFSDWVAKIDWDAVGKWFTDMAGWLDKAATAIGGWETVGKIVLGFYVAGKMSPFILALAGLVGVMTTMTSSLTALIVSLATVLALYEKVTTGTWDGGLLSKLIPGAKAEEAPAWSPAPIPSQGGTGGQQQPQQQLPATTPPETSAGHPTGSSDAGKGIPLLVMGGEVSGARPLPVTIVGMPDDETLLGMIVRRHGGWGKDFQGVLRRVGKAIGYGIPGFEPGASGAGHVTLQQMVDLAKKAGFTGDDAAHIAAIAEAESRGNPGAVGGSGEIGLTQINPHAWPRRMTDEARDPEGAFKAAHEVFEKQGWGAWSTDPSSPNFTPGNSMTPYYGSARKFLDAPPATLGPRSSADDHASKVVSMRTIDKHYHVPGVTVYAKGGDARSIAAEIRIALADQMALAG